MPLDLTGDMDIFFDDFAGPVLLWPGTAQERAIKGIYDGPFQLVSQGQQVGVMSLSPTLTCKTADLEGLHQGDPLRVLPAPALGVAGGDYKMISQQPDGTGVSTLELHKV